MLYRLNLEEMEGRWIAHAPALPGCFASADSLHDVMSGATQAIADHLAWLYQHGEKVAPQNIDTELGEVHRAWNSAPDYEVNAFFATDRPPPTQAEIAQTLRLLEWTRFDLLAALEGLTPEGLTRELNPGWSIVRILNHVANAEWWYLDRLGLADPTQELPNEPFARLTHARKRLRAGLASLAADERVVEKNGELWSPRKLLRRALWHERDHTAHIHQFRN